MADTSGDVDRLDAARIGFDTWLELAEEQVDRDSWASFCETCGVCVAGCPAARFGVGYDPRIILLKERYGLADELLTEHSILWQCFRCGRCAEICPQPVKPFEMVGRLRSVLVEFTAGSRTG